MFSVIQGSWNVEERRNYKTSPNRLLSQLYIVFYRGIITTLLIKISTWTCIHTINNCRGFCTRLQLDICAFEVNSLTIGKVISAVGTYSWNLNNIVISDYIEDTTEDASKTYFSGHLLWSCDLRISSLDTQQILGELGDVWQERANKDSIINWTINLEWS